MRFSQLNDRGHAKWATYGVACFYVVVGFAVTGVSTVRADPLGTLFGFLIVGGAVAVGVLVRAIGQIGTSVHAVAETVGELRERFDHLERLTATLVEQSTLPGASSDGGVRLLDLSAIGSGDPSMLAAATLTQGAYPRLAEPAHGEEPQHSPEPGAEPPPPRSGEGLRAVAANAPDTEPDRETTDGFIRRLELALQNGDLADCRALYASLARSRGKEALAPLHEEVEALADRVERALREAFTGHVHGGDFAAAIAIGERICHLLPDRAVCADFRRLEPHLSRRNQQSQVLKGPSFRARSGSDVC
jgi:hypothetical protein